MTRFLLFAVLMLGADKSGFTTFRSSPSVILEGNWESCREEDGGYGERVFDYYDPTTKRPVFEFHLGPEKEFALFRGVQDDHRGHHDAGNLFWPHINGDSETGWSRTWRALGYVFRVTLAGGSFNDCESWFVTVTRAAPTSR